MFWSLWRCAVADILYKLSGAPIRELVDADVERNLKWDSWARTHTGKLRRLNYCLLKKKEFRSVFQLRMRHHKFLCWCNDRLLPRFQTIEFGTEACAVAFLNFGGQVHGIPHVGTEKAERLSVFGEVHSVSADKA